MKAPPKKSALEGTVNAAATAAVANELLNEMQRNAGGDSVQEDVSRYRVTFRRPGSDSGQWSGEVIGRPQLFPQKRVVALTAGKSVLVFDKSGKKLWESKLNYEVVGGGGDEFDVEDSEPASPCAEHGDALYVFDQGVLSAFDLATGNARWRVPSVGVSQIFFDDKGALYANTTTATPDNIKFARQIDVNDKINPVIMKVDAKTGKILWQLQRKGQLNYVSGKFLYSVEVQQGDEYEEISDLEKIGQAFHGAPHVFIWRINQKSGDVMWEHYQERPPLDVQFEKNRIELLFKKELQVLKYFSL